MVSAWSIYEHRLLELKVLDESSCHNFVRMDAAMFEELLGMVAPLIIRNEAKMRQSISRTTSSDIIRSRLNYTTSM